MQTYYSTFGGREQSNFNYHKFTLDVFKRDSNITLQPKDGCTYSFIFYKDKKIGSISQLDGGFTIATNGSCISTVGKDVDYFINLIYERTK